MPTYMMYQRRPEWLEELIAEEFKLVSTSEYPEVHYRKHGQGIYDYLGSAVLSSTVIRDTANRLGRKVRVLDVGMGAGQVVAQARRDGHDAQGVSAVDYRKTELVRDIPDESYIVGDAHRLQELPDIKSGYDVVLSRLTLGHLADPLSVIEQMADLVGEGGALAIDNTMRKRVDYRTPDGTQYNVHACIEDFVIAGFELHPTAKRLANSTPDGLPFSIPDLVATRRTSGPVRFEVEYGYPTGAE